MQSFKTNFLTEEHAQQLALVHKTPIFVYSTKKLIEQAETIAAIPAPFGLDVRFAMKANPHPEILRIFHAQGIKIDASSGYEAQIAIENGYQATDILLTSQQLATNFKDLVSKGVHFNATSLHQLEEFGKAFPGGQVSVRINPGIGSGHSAKTNVGGPTSSFGIWYEYIAQIHDIAKQYNLKIIRMHTHIGAGTDPAVWQDAAKISLGLIKSFPDAEIINLGGGFKVARMDEEHGSLMQDVGQAIVRELESFTRETGRELRLELEPGTYLVANAGILMARVDDIVDTGNDGYRFLKLDTGMNDVLRPSLYGSQHPIAVVNSEKQLEDYVVVGHNCESGDLITPAPGDPEALLPRLLGHANIGELVLIGGCGAYCASMSAHGYNSYPSAQEIIV